MTTLAREFDACGECRLEVGGPDKHRTLSDDEIREIVTALEGRREILACAAALPGAIYMDPPDGGDVPISEQLRRMAKDAARYRWLRAENSGPIGIVRYAIDSEDEEHMSMAHADEAIDAAMEVTPNANVTGLAPAQENDK